MTYELKIEGEYKSRFRIQLFGRWIEGPWTRKKFSQSWKLDGPTTAISYAVPKLPIQINASFTGNRATVEVFVIGTEVAHEEVSIPAFGKRPFRIAPWKGVEVSGTALLGSSA